MTKQANPSFDVSPMDAWLIRKLAQRARTLGDQRDQTSIEMDLTAVHANGCPLVLQGLLKADDFNFLHDVYGIARHLDRDSGKLTNFFLPRYAAPEAGESAA